MKELSFRDRMTISVPEGELGGLVVERFEVKKFDLENMREARIGRGTKPGWYTRLIEPDGDIFWMSDTDAEKSDHLPALFKIDALKARRVLINGLGLGMVLQGALSYAHVEHVDVVERDGRVIKLIGPHYLKDPRVTIHHADAYEQVEAWPRNTRWDVGWSDIWPQIDPADLPERKQLQEAYGAKSRRCTWHRCWAAPEVDRMNRAYLRKARAVAGILKVGDS